MNIFPIISFNFAKSKWKDLDSLQPQKKMLKRLYSVQHLPGHPLQINFCIFLNHQKKFRDYVLFIFFRISIGRPSR